MARRRQRTLATSNAAAARRANRQKQRLLAGWAATGSIGGSVPSGTGTTALPTAGAGTVLGGSEGTSGTASVDTDVTGPGSFFVNFFSDELPAYLKIAAGGLGLIITGLALVFVAGRNTPVGQVASTVATVTPVGKIAKGAGSVATGRKALAGERAAHTATKASAAERSRVNLAKRRETGQALRTERRERKFYQGAYERTSEAREGRRAASRTKVLPRIEGVKGGSGKAYKR